MFESLAIMIVFFFLLMFGFIFYTNFQKISYGKEAEKATILNSIKLSEQIFSLPEMQCIGDRRGCIDLFKLEAAYEVINLNQPEYFVIFGNSNVTLRQVYPGPAFGEGEWQIYDFPKNQYSGVIKTNFPIALYDPAKDTFAYGVLTIGVYR